MVKQQTHAEKGSIQLDNQCIQVKILMPSGRFQVKDKVSGISWTMQPGRKSGSTLVKQPSGEREYIFGAKGKNGIQFKTNYYLKRLSGEDDFHDVSLSGIMGNDPNNTMTLRYLISTTFPVLNCFCFFKGDKMERIKKIRFPLGFQIPDSSLSHIYIPQDPEKYTQANTETLQNELWEPPKQEEHRVVGTPFFIATQKKDEEKSSGVIGFLQHPLSLLEIHRGMTGRFVTPSSARLDETGKSEDYPYHIRYQFVPTDDLEAITWLCWEHLTSTSDELIF